MAKHLPVLHVHLHELVCSSFTWVWLTDVSKASCRRASEKLLGMPTRDTRAFAPACPFPHGCLASKGLFTLILLSYAAHQRGNSCFDAMANSAQASRPASLDVSSQLVVSLWVIHHLLEASFLPLGLAVKLLRGCSQEQGVCCVS